MQGAAWALLAAALFGASAPIAKLLLPGSGPMALAGILYLGAGIALSLVPRRTAEARLRRADAPQLIGVALAGGVAGPILMLIGLQRLPALTSSLLLNLETPFTMLLAVTLLGEHLVKREVTGAALIVAGAASLQPMSLQGGLTGWLAIAAACLCWAIDNNLMQRLSLRDPVAVVRFKAVVASMLSLGLAVAFQQRFGSSKEIAGALVLGSLSYGLSIVLNVAALRDLGAARVAPLFALAPFVGAVLSVPLLGERPTWRAAAGAFAMIAGVAVFLRARHSHEHTHEALEHDHLHVHDEHHQHAHDGAMDEPHSHPHRHETVRHDHPHVSDIHHRHTHRT